MAWSTINVTGVAVAEGPRERTRSARASAQSGSLAASDSSPVGAGSASELSLGAPVVFNTKAVSNSDELVLHRPKVAKEALKACHVGEDDECQGSKAQAVGEDVECQEGCEGCLGIRASAI